MSLTKYFYKYILLYIYYLVSNSMKKFLSFIYTDDNILLYISWEPKINITMEVINKQKLAGIALLLIIKKKRKWTKLKRIWARH